ncbi:BgTH12-00472 [Blumeria graminis f. sp. triticale]|uniref:BgTH12-00469 n=1 Tax=Blumeria graminis f. sp. triticale TaxID=1689686 RepID=A0A9W4D553_BLUGR|nr:BgTH12-00469 [Blumeria graminis f. sp. triticale]CAD6504973.1 BgTH12-00472 [Blumeria graminis f. sp. triticale]
MTHLIFPAFLIHFMGH